MTIQLILQIKVFDQIYLLSTGTKANVVLVQYVYMAAFQQNESGYGSTIALALFVVVSEKQPACKEPRTPGKGGSGQLGLHAASQT